MISLSVSGAEQVAKRFAAAAVASTKRLDSLDTAAMLVTRSAKIHAAVDTGFMRAGIHPERVSHWEADVISPAEYSIYQEVGTYKMPAHPFMRPALDENADKIRELIGREAIMNVQGALVGGGSMAL